MRTLVILAALVLFAGCGGQQDVKLVEDDEPLTVEMWSEIEGSKKYELDTLERLREHDPKLKDEQKWKKFMKDVVVPQRMKDIPTDYQIK